jgi:hypothetical protein
MAHHSFDLAIAKATGSIEQAIVLNHIGYWIAKNKASGINFHKKRTWTYMTYQQLSDYFWYMKPNTVRYAIENLVKNGWLIKDYFNEKLYDKTGWYALSEATVKFYSGSDEKSLEKITMTTVKNYNAIPNTIKENNSNTLNNSNTIIKGSAEKEFKEMTEIWFEWFEKNFKRKPQFNGTCGKNLKSIAKKITSLKPDVSTTEFFYQLLEFRGTMTDQWLKDNMLDLKIFDSKFDLIINNIKKSYDKGQDRKTRYSTY